MVSKNADQSFCDGVPLNFTNSIQDHGILMVVEPETGIILQASENAPELFNAAIEEIIHSSLDQWLSIESIEKIRSAHHQYKISQQAPLQISLEFSKGLTWFAALHLRDGQWMIEIEFKNEISDKNQSDDTYLEELAYLSSAIQACESTLEVTALAAREIKRISGFDKVMVYVFDEDWNGKVVAEEMESGMERYMGLKFPATDIPKPARDLYLKNPYRLIPNINYQSKGIYPAINPITGKTTDLSGSRLRGVVPVHIEYLQNMKVTASMSTRIIFEEKLWGLIACHHREAKYLNFKECFLFEYMSALVSSKITSLILNEARNHEENLESYLSQMRDSIKTTSGILRPLIENEEELRKILHCSGLVIIRKEEIFKSGLTPMEEDLNGLRTWLHSKDFTTLQHFPSIVQHYAPAQEFSHLSSGMLVLPIQPYDKFYILAFRPEEISTNEWGGNPDNAISFEEGTTNYHPRNSFRLWEEKVRFHSFPWTREELKIAEKLRNVLVEHTLRVFAGELEDMVKERTRQLDETNYALEQTNLELSQVLHVTSHDLQEPVRKIHLFSSVLEGKAKNTEHSDTVSRILSSSHRVMTLLRNLLNYSRLSQELEFEPVDLNEILKQVLQDLELTIKEKNASLKLLKPLPVIDAVAEQMRQVFHSIISNSLKFGGDEVDIVVDSRTVGNDGSTEYQLVFSDNGPGFKNEYSDQIFNIFSTLGGYSDQNSSGMGLALARKIIEKHQGKVRAESSEGKGVRIEIILPSQQKL